jgi:hypothetical protein
MSLFAAGLGFEPTPDEERMLMKITRTAATEELDKDAALQLFVECARFSPRLFVGFMWMIHKATDGAAALTPDKIRQVADQTSPEQRQEILAGFGIEESPGSIQ